MRALSAQPHSGTQAPLSRQYDPVTAPYPPDPDPRTMPRCPYCTRQTTLYSTHISLTTTSRDDIVVVTKFLPQLLHWGSLSTSAARARARGSAYRAV